MLNSIFHAGTFYVESVAAAMATAAILGLMIALLYKRSGSSVHLGSFAVILAILPLLVGGHYDREWESGDFGSGFGRFWSGALSQCPPRYREKSVLFSLPWLWAGSRYGLLSLAVLLYAGHWDDASGFGKTAF